MRSHGGGRWGEAGGRHGVPVLSPQPVLDHNQTRNPSQAWCQWAGARARDGLLNKYALAGAPPRFFARPPSLFDSHHHLPPHIPRQCSLSDPLFNDFNEITMRECLNLPLERCLSMNG